MTRWLLIETDWEVCAGCPVTARQERVRAPGRRRIDAPVDALVAADECVRTTGVPSVLVT
jgi:hypothetical protein